MTNFGKNLVTLRKRKNLTLVELTNQLNSRYNIKFSKASIDRWEKGTTSPSISHASALADFFDISLDELSGRHNLEIEQQDTMAAHFDKDGLTPEEIDEVNRFIEWVRNKDK